jgi:tetratricopeptide (TPR) repeat protein
MSRCKASEIPRNEAYLKYTAVTRDEGNAADGRFPTASLGAVALCLYLLLSCAPPLLASEVVITDEDQWNFARSLMETGKYDQAAGEFERFIHFFPDNSKAPLAGYLIGVCYLKGRHYEKARAIFFKIVNSEPKDLMAGKAFFMVGESYYREGAYKEASFYYREVIEKFEYLEVKNAALYRLGWTAMQEGRWQEASEKFKRVAESTFYYADAQRLADDSLEGEGLPHKDPTTAGMLAIMPGLGHVYVGRYKDGAVAFLLNALFIWATLEAIDEDLKVLAGILAFIELGWYTGNIYSAVNAAHKHNRKVKNDFLRGLQERMDLRPFMARRGQIGLALNFRF